MPRIREYTQQTTVSGEVGGRRATPEDFGYGREVQQFGETVVSTAAYIKQQEERREVEDASVKMSEARQQWTETYLKRQETMQPGDMTMAPTMKKEMGDYFSSMAEGYSTPAAKKYIKTHGAGMTADFFVRGLQHQTAQAGRKAVADHELRVSIDSNTAYMAPDQYDDLKGRFLSDVENGVGAYGYIKNDPNKELLVEKAKQSIAWHAGQGALKNPAARGYIVGNIQGTPVQTTGDMFQTLMPSIFKTEGGYVENDGKRGPTKYGINGTANGLTPEQVKSLTPEQAQQIYKANYWDKYQLDTLPASTIPLVFDGVINHRSDFARSLVDVAKSGASPQQLADMRKAEYERLMTSDPASFAGYRSSWMGRVDKAMAESTKLAAAQQAPLSIDESKLPSWYGDMSAESKDRFLREAMSMQRQERAVADQALARTIQDHQAELAMYGGQLRSPMLPQSAFVGKPLEWEKYQSMIKAGEKVATVTNAPEAEQAVLLESLKPQASAIPGVFDYQTDLYVNAVKTIEASNKRRRDDPIEFAASSGFSRDNPIQPLKMDDPAQFAQSLIVRDPQATAVSKAYNTPYRLMTKQESEAVRKSFDQMDTRSQTEWIGTMRGALPADKFRSMIGQMANGDKALIGAGFIASSQYGGDTRDTDAENIIVGRNALTRALKGGGNEQERAFKVAGLPSGGDAYKLAAKHLQGLLGVPEAMKEAVVETAMAHYIGSSLRKNSFATMDLSGDGTSKNQAEFVKSVNAIAPISTVGAYTVLRPYGMSDEQFQDQLAAYVTNRFAGQAATEGFSLKRGGYSVMMAGNGGYQLVAGGRAIGEPFQLQPVSNYSNEGYGMPQPRKSVEIQQMNRPLRMPPSQSGNVFYQESNIGSRLATGWQR